MPNDLAYMPTEFRNAAPVSSFPLQARVGSEGQNGHTCLKLDAGFRDRKIMATVIAPLQIALDCTRPVLALHGISRDNEELIRLCAPFACATGRVVIVPHFDCSNWPVFQRISKEARPDYALLGLLDEVWRRLSMTARPVDIFGYSGGAQLAHRFAMLYPHLVGDLHLGAAGWYTMPRAEVSYPYGFGASERGKTNWGRRMKRALPQYLNRKITVYAGDRDIDQGKALRQSALLERHQGAHRLERGARYAEALNQEAARIGMALPATFVCLPDCGHSMSECAVGGILEHVFGCTPVVPKSKAGVN